MRPGPRLQARQEDFIFDTSPLNIPNNFLQRLIPMIFDLGTFSDSIYYINEFMHHFFETSIKLMTEFKNCEKISPIKTHDFTKCFYPKKHDFSKTKKLYESFELVWAIPGFFRLIFSKLENPQCTQLLLLLAILHPLQGHDCTRLVSIHFVRASVCGEHVSSNFP